MPLVTRGRQGFRGDGRGRHRSRCRSLPIPAAAAAGAATEVCAHVDWLQSISSDAGDPHWRSMYGGHAVIVRGRPDGDARVPTPPVARLCQKVWKPEGGDGCQAMAVGRWPFDRGASSPLHASGSTGCALRQAGWICPSKSRLSAPARRWLSRR